jgi:hypothetical protein
MKKILKNTGVLTKDGVDYLAKFRNAPDSEIKRSSLADLIRRVEEARIQKMKKAS